MKKIDIPPLNLYPPRPISPGGCPSAGDFEMHSPISWCGSLVLPDRPRSAQSRRPSFSASDSPGGAPPSAWRVLPGSYVAFQLNLTEIANNYPPDSKAAQLLLTFQGGRYIGLVVNSFLTRDPTDTHYIEDITVLYVSDAPPPLPEAERFFLPIAPFEIEGVETEGRRPIKTKEMFPLPNRVQWTTFGARLQIKTLIESKLAFKMDDDEFSQVEVIVTADMAAVEECPPSYVLKKLRVPEPHEPVPATIWRDIRGEHRIDPTDYVVEVHESAKVSKKSDNQLLSGLDTVRAPTAFGDEICARVVRVRRQ
ncbi:hypothetical protein C8Q80DRAFT_1266349 [Daedaleopsis nitida]|nr:hypothetical protein C8Q80DRAFT_1266349 [Daedaleopsis nitida]